MLKRIGVTVSVSILLLGVIFTFSYPDLGLFLADAAIICDGTIYGSTGKILSDMGLSYHLFLNNSDHYYTADFDLLFHYPRVIFCNEHRLITSGEQSALNSYLAAGGNLLVTGWDSLGDPQDHRLADVVRSKTTGDNDGEPDLYVREPTHPIMNGSYGSFPEGFHIDELDGDNDLAKADTTRGAVTVAQLADGYDKIIATQTAGGRVVYWNGIGFDDWSYTMNCTAMFKNAIVWLYLGYEHDLGVLLEVLSDIQVGWSTEIKATVYNRGLNDETYAEFKILINGSIIAHETLPLLESGTNCTFAYSWAPPEGIYNVTAFIVPFLGEQMTVNNVESKVVRVLFYYASVWQEPDYLITKAFPDSFEVTFKIRNVTDIRAYQVNIEYDPDVLRFAKYRFRPDFIFNYSENLLTMVEEPLKGTIMVGALLVGWPEEVQTFTGEGTLCHVEFTAIHVGSSPISISEVLLIDSSGNQTGAMFPFPSGSVDVKLVADSYIVNVDPSDLVVSWNFTSEPNTMDFNFSVLGGISHCRVSVPLSVMDGPFEIIIDNNPTSKIAYSLEFDATHAFLHFDYDLKEGVHNIKVIEGISMCPFGDLNEDGLINIIDVAMVAANFGKSCGAK